MRISALVLALVSAAALSAQVRIDSEKPEWFSYGFLQSQGSYLGINLTDITADRAQELKLGEPRGVEVKRVTEGSPADKAGVKPGDVILTYNGENVLGAQQLGRLVRETPVGRKVRIQLWRDGRSQTVTAVTEAERSPELDLARELKHMQIPNFNKDWVLPEIPTPLMLWNSTRLGIECEEVNPQLAEYFGVKHGLLVRSVTKGSPAEKAGVKAGDVLVSIGDRSITSAHDLTGFLRMKQESDKPISVALVREHKELTFNIVPRENPE
ncbi:MAG: PDZ domain-containing protein [Acidobacteriaceae bacterium]|nr:PDZ domain-containing protein [Acidobacteriaceae bacterium]MBV9779072.1 PDZ domain-containing protein [Acidobacteriaceae bacterium]